MALKSCKIFDGDGGLFGVLIVRSDWPVKDLNDLIHKGLNRCTVTNERSDLVDKKYVDTE